jgi:hypothetical protein
MRWRSKLANGMTSFAPAACPNKTRKLSVAHFFTQDSSTDRDSILTEVWLNPNLGMSCPVRVKQAGSFRIDAMTGGNSAQLTFLIWAQFQGTAVRNQLFDDKPRRSR